MIDRGKHNVAGVLVDAVDYEVSVDRIISAARARRPFAATALAVHGVCEGAADEEQQHRLNTFDLVAPDGQPVRWAMRWLHGVALPDRVYGPTLMLQACARAADEGLAVYLYGSTDEVMSSLVYKLQERFPDLVLAGAEPSKFRRLGPEEKRAVADRIDRSGASVVFVGLGCPRQEVWAYEYRKLLDMPIVAVGAAFDFLAGRMRQAPPTMQRAGLEWLFRLRQEPRRLWKRYLKTNPLFLSLILLQAGRIRRFPTDARPDTLTERSYG